MSEDIKAVADATGEIKQRVQGIQVSTEGTVTQISDITQIVSEINEIHNSSSQLQISAEALPDLSQRLGAMTDMA